MNGDVAEGATIVAAAGDSVAPVDRAGWADHIAAAWNQGRQAFIHSGHRLIAAKAALAHGEFAAMVAADLPFGARTAEMLMKIAADPRLANANHGSLLPPSWRTLYELTRLDDEEFERALREGAIKPDMERNDVLRFRQQQAAAAAAAAREPAARACPDLGALAAEGRRHGAILADPPWTFEAYSGKGKQRSAERHYPTMDLDAIVRLGAEVNRLAADDCALFLWATWPHLPDAIEIIEAWGFTYKTCGFLWAKQNGQGVGGIPPGADGWHTGMGYWTRANTEPCLLATRGSPKRLHNDVAQLVVAPVAEHSRKPDDVHARIERLVGGPYIELFARRPRAGWTVWGDEAGQFGERQS